MAEPASVQPYVLWALGVATTALYALVHHIFGQIKEVRTDAAELSGAIREELLRAQMAQDTKLEVIRVEWATRWAEGREDRNVLRKEMQDYHRTDMEQHERMMTQIGGLASRADIAAMLARREP